MWRQPDGLSEMLQPTKATLVRIENSAHRGAAMSSPSHDRDLCGAPWLLACCAFSLLVVVCGSKF